MPVHNYCIQPKSIPAQLKHSLIHQIALTFIKTLGPVTAKSLIAYLGSEEEIFRTSPAKMSRIRGIGDKRASQ
ncbi:hypothetical protein SNE25_24760 [Mucilaginibacter sabulilitoris]|uniref:IS110 family transposase n=1 Tax=Mucilaginibacter sabulilitoris TaxID=1173583 RepID=A0ABZ0TLX4_9SPHI|nr:helix-hairpin-helix domain-containing protein [Mucilaginibacter sabulilitoris]WPU92540.1 hypothetical protein SNE25_24760 [Mucilaginibacter sabulilitoris]